MNRQKPRLDQPDLEKVASAAIKADPEAADSLWRACATQLKQPAIALTYSPEAAQDLIQETLLAAFQSLKSYDPKKPFYPWLYSILYHKYLRWRRSNWVYSKIFKSPWNGLQNKVFINPESQLLAKDLLKKCLHCLPSTQRVVWTLKFIVELEINEIAQILDKSPETIHSHISKARRTIRNNLSMKEIIKK